MRKKHVINPKLIGAIAALKHTEYFVVCDPGLPLPDGAEVIDLTLCAGVPGFMETLSVICSELKVEGYILASEITDKSPELYSDIQAELSGLPCTQVPHEEFKRLSRKARVIVVTGETTSFANVILIGGVSF